MTPALQTCEENCRCQCDYDVKACRDYRAAVAHREAHDRIVREAYEQAYARSMADNG